MYYGRGYGRGFGMGYGRGWDSVSEGPPLLGLMWELAAAAFRAAGPMEDTASRPWAPSREPHPTLLGLGRLGRDPTAPPTPPG